MCVLLIAGLLRGLGWWARKPVNYNRLVDVVTPTDRLKSVRNRCIIEVFVALFVLSHYTFEISVGLGDFVIGLNQISSFSFILHEKGHPIVGPPFFDHLHTYVPTFSYVVCVSTLPTSSLGVAAMLVCCICKEVHVHIFSNACPFGYTAVAESRKVGSVNRLGWCHTLLDNANGRPTHAKLPKTFVRWSSVRESLRRFQRGEWNGHVPYEYRRSTG